MPRDKTESHKRIIEAAREEFLEYGYNDASLRRIASKAGIQVGGLYKHFANKEEVFASLVDPVIKGFTDCYGVIEKDYFNEIENLDPGISWSNQNETVRMMEFIYDHFDEFKLIICRSQGTMYENFTHDLSILEEEVTLKYMKELKKRKIPVKKVNEKEFHLLVTSSVNAIFQAVTHDFKRSEAMHYAKTLEKFYLPAWKALFGI